MVLNGMTTDGTIRSRWLRLVLLMFLAMTIALGFDSLEAAAQSTKSVTWNRYDVTIQVRTDGSYHVVERQEIAFHGGPFTIGFATIPLTRIDDIPVESIAIQEETASGRTDYTLMPRQSWDERPGTFSVASGSAELLIEWAFPTTSDATRTFYLSYDVHGALRVYEYDDPNQSNQQIWWTAISREVTDVAPVRQASVTIMLPRPVPLDAPQLRVGESGKERPEDHTTGGQTWRWERSNLGPGDEFTVRLQVPPVANAQPPTWQQRDDEERRRAQEAEDRRNLLNVIFLGIGLLALAGGGLGLYGLWYSRGRDPHTGAVAEFLPAPPDDLPPGAVGTLLDETADERDIVATLVDLAHRGVIRMQESKGQDVEITLLQMPESLSPFESELLKTIFPGARKAGDTVKLSDVKSRFTEAIPSIKKLLYEELVRRGYFPRSPEATRSTWRTIAMVALFAIVIGGCVGGSIAGGAGFYWFAVAIFAGLAIALLALSSAMPRKTLKGAEAAAKWRAFRKYLGDIERYENVAEGRQIFEKYLPYAVAFGQERSWVSTFARAGAPAPSWWGADGPVIVLGDPYDSRSYPRRTSPRGGRTVIVPGGRGGGSGGGDFDLPSMQEASDQASRSLQRSSNSLLKMLESAARAFSDFSGGGGGGWSGGGGGFGGGGSSGGSSGGGGRGFR